MSFTAESVGGEYAHKLSQNEIPNYSIGELTVSVPYDHAKWTSQGIVPAETGQASPEKLGIKTTNEMLRTSGTQYGWSIYTNGGDKPHNNLQPYVTTYFWKRIS